MATKDVANTQPVTREDVLLLIADGATGPFPLDPIRLMKGALLVSQRGRNQWKSLFNFGAYYYGPFDKSVYISRDTLIAEGLLVASSDGRYATYTLSASGKERVASLEEEIGRDDAEWFRSIGRYVTSLSFTALLQGVYAEYPEYAARSVARV